MKETVLKQRLTKEDATNFFAELFGGEHHIPGKIKEFGSGWCVNSRFHTLATFDYNNLTRLVFMAHEKCIRAEVQPSGPGMLKICIWKRQGTTGLMHYRHPTIEEALQDFRKYKAVA